MKSSSAELHREMHRVVESYQNTPVLVIGDLILDQYVWGAVRRISPEAPVMVVEVNNESKRLGGAANVAKNLSSLGAKVSLCGILGDDTVGTEVLSLLEEDGISISGILKDSTRPTTVKERVIAHAQQVVRVDRESKDSLDSNLSIELSKRFSQMIPASKAVIVSDYAKGAISSEIFNPIVSEYQSGVLGLNSIPVVVDPKNPNFSLYSKASVIKPNRSEAEDASGLKITDINSAYDAAAVLLEKWDTEAVMITLGELGMVLVSKNNQGLNTMHIEAEPREVYDVSGAGDTVSAVFTLSLAVGASLEVAATLANVAAGIVVGEVGTVAVTCDKLVKALESR